jgi:pilus assembly protein CpaE
MKRTLLAADEVVLTVEPDLANLRNAKNFVDLLRQGRRNDSPPRLIINKAGMPKRPEIKADDFAAALNLTPAAVIPFDAHLFGTAANNGQMIAETDAKSPIVEHFDGLARAVTGRAEIKRQKKSAFAPLLSRFRGKKSA